MTVCSLSSAELEDRLEMIRKEILPHVKRSEDLPNGRAWEFEETPALRAKLEEWVELERRCCGGLDWSLERLPANGLRLAVRGIEPGSGFFEALAEPEPTPGSSGGLVRLAKSGGVGLGGALLVCCVLPNAVLAVAGAAVAAPLLALDSPLPVIAVSLGIAVPACLLTRRIQAR